MQFSDMIGKTLESIEGAHAGSERVTLNFTDGTACVAYHSQDCCESVEVKRIEGSIEDIVGSPITAAESSVIENREAPSQCAESWTWTRQFIRTEKGSAVIVWLGESNGFYGETPYFQITHGRMV